MKKLIEIRLSIDTAANDNDFIESAIKKELFYGLDIKHVAQPSGISIQHINIRPDNSDKVMPEDFTRINSDYYGNPRYYISIVDLFRFCPDNLNLDDKCTWIDKKRKGSVLNKYRGKQYGPGYVVQSYNLQSTCNHINEHMSK